MHKTLVSEDFEISAEMRIWAEANIPQVHIDKETQKFIDYFRGKGQLMFDWVATWRNWMRRCPSMGGCMYGVDELRVKKLMAEFEPKGFRRAYTHENAVMYQVAFDAWDMKRRGVPMREMSAVVTSLAGRKRL